MPYATPDQVASEFKNITFDANTSITSDEVTRFIEESDAHIDGHLANKYVVPITGTTSLILIRQISIWLTAQRIKDIQKVKSGFQETNQGTLGKLERLDVKAHKMLHEILEDDLILPDAELLDASSGVYSNNANCNINPIFERDTDQW